MQLGWRGEPRPAPAPRMASGEAPLKRRLTTTPKKRRPSFVAPIPPDGRGIRPRHVPGAELATDGSNGLRPPVATPPYFVPSLLYNANMSPLENSAAATSAAGRASTFRRDRKRPLCVSDQEEERKLSLQSSETGGEQKIMFCDVSNMDESQKAYVLAMREEISRTKVASVKSSGGAATSCTSEHGSV